MPAQFVQESIGPGTTSAASVLTSTANNLLVAFLLWDDLAAFTSLADDLGNTYTQIGSEHDDHFTKRRAYWALNAATGTRTVTLTVGGGSFALIDVVEYAGQHATIPIDSFGFNASDGIANPTDSATTVKDQVMLVAYGAHDRPNLATVTTAGFT